MTSDTSGFVSLVTIVNALVVAAAGRFPFSAFRFRVGNDSFRGVIFTLRGVLMIFNIVGGWKTFSVSVDYCIFANRKRIRNI